MKSFGFSQSAFFFFSASITSSQLDISHLNAKFILLSSSTELQKSFLTHILVKFDFDRLYFAINFCIWFDFEPDFAA